MNARTIAQLRRSHSAEVQGLRGIARRMVAAATGALWQVLGYDDPISGEPETDDEVEVFGGVGFASRPRDGAGAEVIVIHVGAEETHPVIVATRDRSIEVALESDETAIFNSTGTVVRIKKDGTVRLGEMEAPHPACRGDNLQATLNALIAAFNAHVHTSNGVPPTGLGVPAASSGPGDLSPNVKVK